MINRKTNMILFTIWFLFNLLVVLTLLITASNFDKTEIQAIAVIALFSAWCGFVLKDILRIVHLKHRRKDATK